MASNTGEATGFSAASSMLGYLYQVRFALLSSLRRIDEGQSFALYLETRDDVEFDGSGSAIELLQLKHHRGRSANLADASSDLWKSFRIWMEGRSNGTIPADARLFLITTTSVASGSAASKLVDIDRDEGKAVKLLKDTASTSKNATNQRAYNLYLELSDAEKLDLLKAIFIVPMAPSISDVGVNIRNEVRMSVRPEYLDSFVKRLEEWWFGRVLQQLMDKSSPPIHSSEIENKWHALQDQFKLKSLPIDSDIFEIEVNETTYKDAPFVHQARLSSIGNRRIFFAIRDYFRAFTQRSNWVREELLLVGELGSYEKLLHEEWELEFNRVNEDLDENATESAKHSAARKVYAWVETSSYPIRPQVVHPSLTRGSLHILANTLKVGWHPDFEQRLKYLLERKEAV